MYYSTVTLVGLVALVSAVSASPATATASAAAAASKCQWTFPTATCASNPLGCYDTNGGAGYTLQSNGVARTFTLHIPSNFDPSRGATPLALAFHGRTRDSDDQYNLTALYNTTFNPAGWLSAYPQGLKGLKGERAWQGAPYAASGVNDTRFASDLVAALSDCFSIDSKRVYAMGKSNGGGFVDTLACSGAGAKFAAFSSHSGAFYTDNALGDCPAARKTRPYIDFHGGADTTVPYSGADQNSGTVPPIPRWLDFWGQRDGCAAGAGSSSFLHGFPSSNSVNYTTYNCSGTDGGVVVVEGYWIKGLPHDWASTTPNNDNGGKVSFINATPYFVKFLTRFTL